MQNPVQVSGPPLTWENNGTTRSDGSSNSGGSSYTRRGPSDGSSATVTPKADPPPVPKKYDQQATIRHGNSSLAREPSDEEDYGSAYAGQNHHDVDEELPDTTMLDSVVLPAIASVSPCLRGLVLRRTTQPVRMVANNAVSALLNSSSCSPGCRRRRHGSH